MWRGRSDPLTSILDLPPLSAADEENDDDDEEEGADVGGAISSGTVGSLTGTGDSKEWGARWKENMRRSWAGIVPIDLQGESLPYDDQFLDLDPTYRDAYGQPLLRITFDFHQNDYNLYRFLAQRCRTMMEAMEPDRISFTEELDPFNNYGYQSTHNTGGAIMGSDPGNSVTNSYGQVWDTPNVFVTGAALYPQNPGANPTNTLCALAYRTAEAIKERYVREPNRLLQSRSLAMPIADAGTPWFLCGANTIS